MIMEILNSANFATLNNEKTIFYSHIDDLDIVFDKINKIDHDVILISGAGDRCVYNFCAPSNVKYWFAQNALGDDERIIPIPIGMCNPFEHHIPGQRSIGCGGSYEYCDTMSKLLIDTFLNDTTVPNEFMYANFTITTNQGYRSVIKDISLHNDFINYDDPSDVGFISDVGKYESNDGCESYIKRILNHEAILCPLGNGIDTHRLWETLYCKRIAITINGNSFRHERVNQDSSYFGESWNIPPLENEYSIYKKLYSELPIIVLDNYRELFDKEHLQNLIAIKKQKQFNMEILDFNYWKNLILNSEKNLLL